MQPTNPIAYSPVDPGGQMPSAIPSTPQPQPQPQAPPAPHGSFLDKLLPTAGGILGGIGGELLMPFGGGVAGAGAGGALGQELENKLTGSKTSTATSGIENAVGSGIGGALGKIGSMFAGKVVAPLAEKGATKLVAGQAPGVTKDLAEYLAKDNGITDLNQAGQFADVLTGGAKGANSDVDGRAILNKYVEDTLQNKGPQNVQISDLAMSPLTGRNAGIGETIADETNALQHSITQNSLKGTPQANAIRTKVSGILNSIGQNASGEADPMGALDAQRQVAQQANDSMSNYLEGGRKDITLKNMANTYNDISNQLKSRLNLDKIPVSDEDKAALANDINKFGSPINKTAAQNVANEIQNTDGLTLGGVRNLESNWVQVKNSLQQAADQANKNFGTSAGDMARSTLPISGAVSGMGGAKSLLGTVGGLATASPAANKAGAGVLESVANGAQGKLAQKVLPLATRAAIVSAANVPNMAESTNPQNGMIPTGADQMNPGAQQPSSPYNSLLNSMLAEAVLAPNLAGSSGAGSILSSLAPSLQKAGVAQQQLGGLESQFGGAGGAQGMGGGGILDQILSKIPGTAQHAATAQAQQLTGTLGVSPGLAPNFLQSPGTAGTQLSTLQGIIQAMQGGSAPTAIPQ